MTHIHVLVCTGKVEERKEAQQNMQNLAQTVTQTPEQTKCAWCSATHWHPIRGGETAFKANDQTPILLSLILFFSVKSRSKYESKYATRLVLPPRSQQHLLTEILCSVMVLTFTWPFRNCSGSLEMSEELISPFCN